MRPKRENCGAQGHGIIPAGVFAGRGKVGQVDIVDAEDDEAAVRHILAIPAFHNESKLEGVELAEAGDRAYTYGSYRSRLIGEDGKLAMEPGKWLTIWKKQPDGGWQIAVDTYNTDIPPPDHK